MKDIVAANAFFATQSPATGVFNVANGHSTSINDLAAMICRLTGSRSAISHSPERLGDVKHSLASIGKLRATGFAPYGNFNPGLHATIEFFKKQP